MARDLSAAEVGSVLETSWVDYLDVEDELSEREQLVRRKVRGFVKKEVEPVIGEFWARAEYPEALVRKMAMLDVLGGMAQGYGCPGLSALAMCMVSMELARGDGSLASTFGVHAGLVVTTMMRLGSEEQRKRWLPMLASGQVLACFALTEPHSGSEAFSCQTVAKHVDGGWVLNGHKRWIANAAVADVALVWAKIEGGHRIGGFLVERGAPGMRVEDLGPRMAKRALRSGEIFLEECFIAEEMRLSGGDRFRDVLAALRLGRVGVAWEAVGHAMAVYEYALRYAKERMVFGKAIAAFQLTQAKLVRMLSALVSMQLIALRGTRLFECGMLTDGRASLIKLHNAALLREVVALGREILGANGLLIETHVARHFCDAEALFTYEGTQDVNTLIVGRDITGFGAFS